MAWSAGVSGVLAVVSCLGCIGGLREGPDAGPEGGLDGPSADSTNPAGDAGGDGIATEGGATATCQSYAAADCNFGNACLPGQLQATYGTVTNCISQVIAVCTLSLGAPGSGIDAAWLGACQASYETLVGACASGPVPIPVVSPTDPCAVVGAGGSGATCGVNYQCQSAECAHYDTGCGVCAAPVASGGACGNPNLQCLRGLTCGAKGTCVPIVTAGATCDFGVTDDCVTGTDCVLGDAGAKIGTCVASGTKVGAACDPGGRGAPKCSEAAGSNCDAATHECVAITYVPAGSACGEADGGGADNVCAGSMCVAGACVGPIALSQPCVFGGPPCGEVAECVVVDGGNQGTCQPIHPTCKNP